MLMVLRYVFLFLLAVLVFSGCRSSRDTARSGQVFERGEASWYGPGFHGKQTANGERYDQDGMTAAHRTLPFDTVVRVKNLSNGKHVDVRINDRGPYVGNRIIDLSRQAAEEIGLRAHGIGRVRLEIY